MFPRILLLATLIALPLSTAVAEGIPIEPGEWKITTTMEMPMLPQPRVQTQTHCFSESEISPESMSMEDLDPRCTFDSEVDGSTMKWSMEGPAEGGSSRGDWTATSGGDTVKGNGVITAEFQGQSMVMNMSWDGARIGDCQ
jgi:hypothetical protein